jgi:hypothetical protein
MKHIGVKTIKEKLAMSNNTTTNNPAFYVSGKDDLTFTQSYGWYSVFTVGKLSIIDRRQGHFGSLYTNTEQLTQKGGITSDKQLYELLADGHLVQIKSPFFVIWEIGKDKPFEERYFSMTYACQKAHAMAVSEPAAKIKENTNV